MAYCSVYSCKNSTEKCSFRKHGVTYHKFPKIPDIKNKWITATGRPNWEPTPHSKMCSHHFKDSDYYKSNITTRRSLIPWCVPTMNIWKMCSELSGKPICDDLKRAQNNKDSTAAIMTQICDNLKRVNNNMDSTAAIKTQEYPLIVRVYLYLEKEYKYMKDLYGDLCDLTPLSDILKRTAEATGLNQDEVIFIMKHQGLEQHIPDTIKGKKHDKNESELSDTISDKTNIKDTQIKIEPEDQLDTLHAIQMDVTTDLERTSQQLQLNIQPRPYSNAERQKRYREKRKAEINSSSSSNDSIQQEQEGSDVEINKKQAMSSAERQRKYRKLLREHQKQQIKDNNSIKPRKPQNAEQAERKRYLNSLRQSRFRAKRKYESSGNSSHQPQTEREDGDCFSESDEIFGENNYDSDCETKPVIDIEIEPTKISTISDTVGINTEIQKTLIKIEPIDYEDQIKIKSETTVDTSKEDQDDLTVKDEYLEEDNYDSDCETKPVIDIEIEPTTISTLSKRVNVKTEIENVQIKTEPVDRDDQVKIKPNAPVNTSHLFRKI